MSFAPRAVSAVPPAVPTTKPSWSETDPLRVFVVDDHPLVRDGLKVRISSQSDMKVAGEADSGLLALERLQALQQIKNLDVNIVVMDVSLPDGNGAEITAQIKARWPAIRILALSMHEDKSYLRSMLEAGASGYILKRSATEDLIRALRVVSAGGTYLDPAISQLVAQGFLGRNNNASRIRGVIEGAPLSEREEEVLRLLSRGLTSKEISGKIFLSAKTVDTYKSRAMEKLGLETRADIIRFGISQGWLNNLE